jgi:DNA primase
VEDPLLAAIIPDDTIRAIQNAADIVEIISERVLLKKAGRNLVGLCPFHAEKTPSFSVNPERQIFHCFGCGIGGDVFSFLMKQDGISFPEAARALAARYGIQIPEPRMSPEAKQKLSEKEQLLRVNREAMGFFQQMLKQDRRGQKAMTYLIGRGMTRKLIDDFGLGYSPADWDALAGFFAKRKVSLAWVEKAGLIVARKGGNGYYDRFRDRVIFPICDLNQEVIGFGGRVMDDALPKYLNSPETPVYHKSRCLYGMHRAKQPCRMKGSAYLVEGYFDLLALHLHGIENSVATLGTSLTAEHVQLLRSFVGSQGQVILVYDSDEAGIKAAQRSVDIFEAGFLNARIMVLPSGYDPDTYIMQYGPDDFFKLAERSMAMMPYLLEMAIRKHGLSIEGKLKIISDLKRPLVAVGDSLARSLQIRHIAERLDIDEGAVLAKVREILAESGPSSLLLRTADKQGRQAPSGQFSGANRMERHLVAMMLQCPQMLPEIRERGLVERLEDPELQAVGRVILECALTTTDYAAETLLRLERVEVKSLVAELTVSEEHWDLAGCQRLLNQFESSRKQQDKDLLQRIRQAEETNDLEQLKLLLMEKQRLAKRG